MFFFGKLTALVGSALLLCIICLTLLASFFLPSHLSLHHYNYYHIYVHVHVYYTTCTVLLFRKKASASSTNRTTLYRYVMDIANINLNTNGTDKNGIVCPIYIAVVRNGNTNFKIFLSLSSYCMELNGTGTLVLSSAVQSLSLSLTPSCWLLPSQTLCAWQ